MKKRLMSLILAMMMVFSLLSTSASAMESIETNEIPTSVSTANIAPNKLLSQQEAVTVTYSKLQEPVDLSAEADTIMYFGDAATYRAVAMFDEIENIYLDNIVFPDIKTQQLVGLDSFVTTFSSNQTFHTSGTISESGGMFVVYPITLGTGCNIHAELVGPADPNLNYILYLATVDSTGSISGIIDACAYAKALMELRFPKL